MKLSGENRKVTKYDRIVLIILVLFVAYSGSIFHFRIIDTNGIDRENEFLGLADSPKPPKARPIQRLSCGVCPFATQETDNVSRGQQYIYKFHSTLGTGRSGNIVYQIWKILLQVYACKGVLVLPSHDALGAFPINEAYKAFDFSQRAGTVDVKCPKEPQYLEYDNLGPLNFINHTDWDFLVDSGGRSVLRSLADCLRRYYGLCDNYCSPLDEQYDNDLLVVHIRQGDIYPQNFGHTKWSGMGQPPLSYYLSAMSFRSWSRVIVLGEATELKSPVWRALELLERTKTINVTLRSEEVAEDFRLLLCAPTVVLSHSSLNMLLQLGFAKRIFHYGHCFEGFHATEVIIIPMPEAYVPFWNHTNSAEQWVDVFLTPVHPHSQCRDGPLNVFLT